MSGQAKTGATANAVASGKSVEPLTWGDRLEIAINEWDDRAGIPAMLRMDRAFKRAGVRDLIVEIDTLREALGKAIEVIEWCGQNDRTVPYGYKEPRRDGTLPGKGKRFNTPREFADYWPHVLREALLQDTAQPWPPASAVPPLSKPEETQ